jgi:hypothetical protein
MYLTYSLLTLAVFIVVSPYFAYQAIRYKKYVGSLRERLGYLPISFNVDGEESLWIHAVSVGEALTARALAADLKARYPRLRLFLSTTTIAGQQVARRSLQHVDAVFYFPFDWAFIVRRTLKLVKPRVFIMMETEIWPNLLRVCEARREDGGHQRADFLALVSALPAHPSVLPARPRRRRSFLHAERRVGAPPDRSGRRSLARERDRQPKVRLARAADAGLARQAPRARAALFPALAPSHGDCRGQHVPRRRGGGARALRG